MEFVDPASATAFLASISWNLLHMPQLDTLAEDWFSLGAVLVRVLYAVGLWRLLNCRPLFGVHEHHGWRYSVLFGIVAMGLVKFSELWRKPAASLRTRWFWGFVLVSTHVWLGTLLATAIYYVSTHTACGTATSWWFGVAAGLLLGEQTAYGLVAYVTWLFHGAQTQHWEFWPMEAAVQGGVALVVLLVGVLVTAVGGHSDWFAIGAAVLCGVLLLEIPLRWITLRRGRPSTMGSPPHVPSFINYWDLFMILPLLAVVVGLILTLALNLSVWYAVGSALLLLLALLVWLAILYSRIPAPKASATRVAPAERNRSPTVVIGTRFGLSPPIRRQVKRI